MHALLLLLYILPFIHPSIFIFLNYKKGCTLLTAASDKVYQLPAHGRWFSPGTPASSTTKTGRHDIAEILLKVALNTKNQSKSTNTLCKSVRFRSLFESICTPNTIGVIFLTINLHDTVQLENPGTYMDREPRVHNGGCMK